MKRNVSGAIGVAIGMVAFAIATEQPNAAAQSQSPASVNAPTSQNSADQITVTGCVRREADYRKATDAGRGGAAATGLGLANEFVLTNAMMSTGTGTSAATSGGGTPSPTGTAGSASNITYELTGTNEGQAATYVGKRVEITGKMKAIDAGTLGGPTAAVPGSQDLRLRELDVSSIREVAGACPAMTPAPAPKLVQ